MSWHSFYIATKQALCLHKYKVVQVWLTKYQVCLTCGKHKKYDLSVKSYPDIEYNTLTEEQHELVANYLDVDTKDVLDMFELYMLKQKRIRDYERKEARRRMLERELKTFGKVLRGENIDG
ncbi:hypothetical protein p113_111 [Enterococcus phage 113]|uniref:Uncharacterized protein n=1 Tax=Enterococcus phage 113 TaxID=2835638 RepID=A0A8E7L336_9CAUD|nr:hypothetical protein p113_111 [Enterococcus phage 113]